MEFGRNPGNSLGRIQRVAWIRVVSKAGPHTPNTSFRNRHISKLYQEQPQVLDNTDSCRFVPEITCYEQNLWCQNRSPTSRPSTRAATLHSPLSAFTKTQIPHDPGCSTTTKHGRPHAPYYCQHTLKFGGFNSAYAPRNMSSKK